MDVIKTSPAVGPGLKLYVLRRKGYIQPYLTCWRITAVDKLMYPRYFVDEEDALKDFHLQCRIFM